MSSRPTIRQAGVGAASKDNLYFSSPKKHLEFIPTGCIVLDCVLGGGWPLGLVVNIVGDKSTGKTLLAIEAIANFFLKYDDGECWYNEAEAALDTDYAKALGVPMHRVKRLEEHDTVEQVFDSLEGVLNRIKGPGLYILDSLDALSDEAEMKRGISDGSYGAGKPKKMSELFRRLVRKVKRKRICVIIISQTRDKIGVTFGEKHSRSGGKALDFYASQVLWLSHIKTLKRQSSRVERPIGVRIRAKCKKNKVGLPLRECDFNIRFGYGVDDTVASTEFLQEVGVKVPVSISPVELAKLVQRKWYEIERSFLPTRGKYDASR